MLERHPFTTQTFVPLGLAPGLTGEGEGETWFLVIVAPSVRATATAGTTSSSRKTDVGVDAEDEATISHPPDLGKLRAFRVHGGQAVTYGVGTWHAPMVVVGRERVDFVVTQFVSGVVEEDCQEVRVGEGVVVRVGSVWEGEGENGGRRAKL